MTPTPPAGPPGLRLPGTLGPPSVPAPESLEAFVAGEGLAHAPFPRVREATRRIEGARVRWRLRSWGGEISTVGYDTPSGRQPSEGFGRIRFVSETIHGDLSAVYEVGLPVVTCLARFPNDDEDTFVRSDDRRELTPGDGPIVMVEGTIWGVLRGGGSPNLWLHDCAIVPLEGAAR